MLKQRLITALILIPIFIALLFMLNAQAFCLLTAVIVIWCAWEWSSLMGVKSFPQFIFFPILILLGLIVSLSLYIPFVLYIALGWWLLATILIVMYPNGSRFWGKGKIIRATMGVLTLVPCWLAINFIFNHKNGSYILLFLFILIWGADSAAYFVGKKWGKTKLAALVSPGKSIQGLLGALIATFLIVLIILFLLKVPHSMWLGVILLSLITVVFSVIGDLFESMLKRKEGLKDSGTVLPGHGGILDRLDSLTAAAPIFALGMLLIGKFFH